MRHYAREGLAVLAAGAITFALLFFGQAADTYARIDTPLQLSLASVPGVSHVVIHAPPGGTTIVHVDLAKGADLQSAVHGVDARLAAYGAATATRVIYGDRTDGRLEAAAREAVFPVEQAIQTGAYSALPGEIDKVAKGAGVTSYVSMDSRAIYLELTDGQHFKVEIFPLKG